VTHSGLKPASFRARRRFHKWQWPRGRQRSTDGPPNTWTAPVEQRRQHADSAKHRTARERTCPGDTENSLADVISQLQWPIARPAQN